MATPSTRWSMSILVLILCVTAEGLPLAPSHLVCFIPCSYTDCITNINCTWDERQDNNTPTNYTLYWQIADSKEEHVASGNRYSAIIPRDAPRDKNLHVWVRARNHDGFSDSKKLVFNAEDITKPPPPKFSHGSHEPSEVHWIPPCDELSFTIGQCQVRHRIKGKSRFELEDGFHCTYTLIDPIPGIVYEFQVRCSCHTKLMSDWSVVHNIASAELAPVGEVDVWRDCGMFPTTSACYLTWKNLPPSQARGVILGYEVRISYSNETTAVMNVSTADPSSDFVHDGKKWHFASPLKDVSSVSVSAYNALGATLPSSLPLSLKGKQQNDQPIYLNMNESSLTVSWDLPAQLSEDMREYVVQYKEAGCTGGHGFDWIKVNKNKTAGFTGQFENYMAYQVSLFQISHHREIHHLKSEIIFSHEKAPPAVSSFKVSSVGENEVSLVWELIPLKSQGGLILYYQIGIGANKVHNVSASPHHENYTYKMQRLVPGQDYEIWIRAINAAGPGPKVPVRVTTNRPRDYALLIGIPAGIIAVVIGICVTVVGLSACQRHKSLSALLPQFLNEIVPDPRNSNICKEMSEQMNEPAYWTCIPISGQDPQMSVLEILVKKSQDFQIDGLTRLGLVDECSQMDCPDNERSISVNGEHDKPGYKYGRAEYSKMIDSDEDSHSSDEEQFSSGYEQHFMPTAIEIVGI